MTNFSLTLHSLSRKCVCNCVNFKKWICYGFCFTNCSLLSDFLIPGCLKYLVIFNVFSCLINIILYISGSSCNSQKKSSGFPAQVSFIYGRCIAAAEERSSLGCIKFHIGHYTCRYPYTISKSRQCPKL